MSKADFSSIFILHYHKHINTFFILFYKKLITFILPYNF